MAHRLLALAVVVMFVTLAWRLWVAGGACKRFAVLLVALLLAQVASGLSNVVLGWPLLAAVSHTGGAAALVVLLTGLIFSSRSMTTAHASKLPASRLPA